MLIQYCILSYLIRRIYQNIFVRFFSFAKGQQTFKIKPVIIYSQDHPRRDEKKLHWYETQYLPWTLTFIFIATKLKQLFYGYIQSMKKQFWQLFKYVYFFHFELLASNTIKNETEKIEKLTWNNFFSKVFIRIPGKSRSYRHIIKPGFSVDIARLFLQR